MLNFRATIHDHTWKTVIATITDFMEMDLWSRLSEWSTWTFCVKCSSPDLAPWKLWQQDFDAWLEPCNFVKIECCDEFWWQWSWSWFIYSAEELLDRRDCIEKICVEMIDCAERLRYRLTTREIEFPQSMLVEDMITEVWNELNDNCPLNPLVLWEIKAPITLPDEHWDNEWIKRSQCTSFYEILQDLADRTEWEWRFCDTVDEDWCPQCELQFSVPDEDNCPYWTGVLLDWTYIYNSQAPSSSNIKWYSIKDTNKWFCNSKRSKTAWSDTEYCLIENEESIEKCWKYECCEDDPQWHNVIDESMREPVIEVTIDGACESYCDVKVWDRREVRINTCRCRIEERQVIILEKHIRCNTNMIEVDYETSTINALRTRRTTQRSILNNIFRKLRKWELY